MLGLSGTKGAKTIHLVDFGMAKEYVDRVTQKHIRLRSNRPMLGTACFMSCNAHFNYELSRRDDLEALGYMLLYFLKGSSVPWSDLLQFSPLSESTPMKQLQKIGSMKQALSPEDIFEDCPEEFAKYLRYWSRQACVLTNLDSIFTVMPETWVSKRLLLTRHVALAFKIFLQSLGLKIMVFLIGMLLLTKVLGFKIE